MDYQADLDLSQDIRSLVEPLVSNPSHIVIERVLCDKEDLGKLIGRHGVISDSIRTILNVSNKNMRKKIHLRFASFEEVNRTFDKE